MPAAGQVVGADPLAGVALEAYSLAHGGRQLGRQRSELSLILRCNGHQVDGEIGEHPAGDLEIIADNRPVCIGPLAVEEQKSSVAQTAVGKIEDIELRLWNASAPGVQARGQVETESQPVIRRLLEVEPM